MAVTIYAPGTPQFACMSGTALLDGVRSLEEILGVETVAAAKARLSASQREDLETATVMSWIAVTTSAALFDAAAEISGRDWGQLLEETVRRTSTRLLKGVWRPLLRLTTEEAMVKRTQALYARARNTGQLATKLVEPGFAVVELTGWPDVSDRQLHMIALGNDLMLELTGRQRVNQTYARTAEGARFELRWRR